MYVGIPGNSSVSSNSNNYSNYFSINIAANATVFNTQINVSEFYNIGYATGNTATLAFYVVGGNLTASAYQDLTTNKTQFTALSSSPIFSTYLVP
jgi:hypothetical protein